MASYRRQANTAATGRSVVFVLLVVFILVSPPLAPLRQQLGLAFQPLAHGLYRLGVATSPFRYASPNEEVARRNAEAAVARLETQNQALRRQLGMLLSSDRLPTVGADIVGRQDNALSRYMRINRGTEDGIAINMAVMPDGYLIGKISAASKTHADVQLITDPDFRLTATVGESQTAGLLVGSLGGMKLQRLPNTQDVQVGDNVLTSNLGEQVPTGLPVGLVTGVRQVDAVFYELDVETPVPLERISVVQVVKP